MPGEDDEHTLPDALAPKTPKETFDDDEPLSFVPPKVESRATKVPPLLRALGATPPPPASVPAPRAPKPPSEPPRRPLSEAPIELDDDALFDPDELVREWARALDGIDYLTLLDISRDEELDDERVRRAWRSFALAFHPDRHRDAPEDVWMSTTQVFQRGAEAYRVLQDPALRKRYLELLASEGAVRMSHHEVDQVKSAGDDSQIKNLVHTPAARAFAEKAEELLAAGKLEAARLQLQLASMKEPDNARLRRRLSELEQRIAEARSRR